MAAIFLIGCLGNIYSFTNDSRQYALQYTDGSIHEIIGIIGRIIIIGLSANLMFISKGIPSKIYWGVFTVSLSFKIFRDYNLIQHTEINTHLYNILDFGVLFALTVTMLHLSKTNGFKLFGKYEKTDK